MQYTFDFAQVWGFRWALMQGLMTTLSYVALSVFLGTIAGLGVASARLSSSRLLRGMAMLWVDVFRGIPVPVMMVWMMFALPILTGLRLTAPITGLACLSLFMSALCAECFRSAAAAIGPDQNDACHALALPGWVRSVFVTLPQMVIFAIPTWLSACVLVFKESALVSTIGITDMMFKGKAIAEMTARPIEILTVVALIYFTIAWGVTLLAGRLERRVLGRIAL